MMLTPLLLHAAEQTRSLSASFHFIFTGLDKYDYRPLYKWGREVNPGLLSIKSRLESRCLQVWRLAQAARTVTDQAASCLRDSRSCQEMKSQPLPQLAVWKFPQALSKRPHKRFGWLPAHKWVIRSPFTTQVCLCFLIWNNTIQLVKPAGRTLLLLFLNIMWKSCWPGALQQAQIVQGL